MLVGARAEVCPCVGLRKGYSTKLPLIRRWRCGARVVEEPGLKRPDSHLQGASPATPATTMFRGVRARARLSLL